jgi:hypothetical protein
MGCVTPYHLRLQTTPMRLNLAPPLQCDRRRLEAPSRHHWASSFCLSRIRVPRPRSSNSSMRSANEPRVLARRRMGLQQSWLEPIRTLHPKGTRQHCSAIRRQVTQLLCVNGLGDIAENRSGCGIVGSLPSLSRPQSELNIFTAETYGRGFGPSMKLRFPFEGEITETQRAPPSLAGNTT